MKYALTGQTIFMWIFDFVGMREYWNDGGRKMSIL